MRTLKLAILTFILAVGFGDRAHADPVWAARVGGTCVPDSATIRAGQYETAGFGVRFAHGVGTIRLLCPFGLDGWDATIGGMQLSVIDQDGEGSLGRIRAQLAPRGRKARMSGSKSAIAIPTHRTRQNHK